MGGAGGITNAVNVGIAVQADWENREFISHISLNVRRLFDFLVQFGIIFRSHLFTLCISYVLFDSILTLIFTNPYPHFPSIYTRDSASPIRLSPNMLLAAFIPLRLFFRMKFRYFAIT